MLVLLIWWLLFVWSAQSMVLDPALYLSPSPPLTAALEDIQWAQPRFAADVAVLPIEQIKTTPDPPETTTATTTPSSLPAANQPQMLDKSDKLLQLLRTSKPSISPYLGIHVPLTFSLTGTYGGYGGGNLGVIGSSYGSISHVEGDKSFSSLYGNTRLAGSSYGAYGLAGSSYGAYGGYGGTRIYGSDSGAAWSGWGNGKWGHYGKG